MQLVAQGAEIESLLLEGGLVDEAQLQRARRIAARLGKAQSPVEVLVELGELARHEYDRVLRTHRSRLGLAELLHEEGTLDEAGFAAYQRQKAATPGRTDREILVDGALVSEERFLRAFSVKHDIPFVAPDASLVDATLLTRTSLPYLQRQRVLPMRLVDGALTVVMADPLDRDLLAELARIFDVPIKACCADSASIQEALLELERLRHGTARPSSSLQYREIESSGDDPGAGENVIQIVDYLITRAIQRGASDLHVEPLENKVRVRLRVDGVLEALTDLPAEFAAPLASRVKVLAGADIAERRLHQDGRVFVKTGGREVDLRVSSYASVFGETLVLRLLDRQRGIAPLDKLGFQPRVLACLREIVLRTSSGLVLVTGPTGSGKTTTLYSFVDFMSDPTLKVISAEDPVEYVLAGVAQCSVNSKSGPTFADSLRAIVRQDPDIIVVGEVRDATTASLAIEAALTGHKVLSTFHTEDAVGAVVRLLEMGVEPFLVSSTLTAIVAQRLVRRVCARCRRPGQAAHEDLRFLSLERSDVAGGGLAQGAGCTDCAGSGYQGRIGIHELLVPDDDFRDAVLRRAASRELRQLARTLPTFLSLQEDGTLKALAGITTLYEVATNAPRDAAARKPAATRTIANGGGKTL